MQCKPHHVRLSHPKVPGEAPEERALLANEFDRLALGRALDLRLTVEAVVDERHDYPTRLMMSCVSFRLSPFAPLWTEILW